jgi:hypothetical protein
VFGDEAADAYLAEVIKLASEFVDGVVEVVGVFVQQREEKLLASFAV